MGIASYCSLALSLAVFPTHAQTPAQIDIPAGPFDQALVTLSRQTGISIGMDGAMPKARVSGVSGRLSPREALERLAGQLGLEVSAANQTAFRLRPGAGNGTNTIGSAPIIVTATKRPADLFSLPLSVSAYSLSDRTGGATGLAATQFLVANANGLNATNWGVGRNRLFIRGVADSAFNGPSQSTVGIFLDDARLNFGGADPDLRLIDVERVEVLKGPQGMLYGSGALGGIYRIVTAKPEVGKTQAFIATEGAITAHGGLDGAASAMTNLSLGPQLALRFVAYGERNAGWIDDVARNAKDVNDVKVAGGRAAMRWQSGAWTADLGLAAQKVEAEDSQYSMAALGDYARATAFAEPYDNFTSTIQSTIVRDEGRLRLALINAFVRRTLDNRFDASASAAQLGYPAPLVYDEHERQSLLSNELRLSVSGKRLRWFGALSHMAAKSALDWSLAGPGGKDADIDAYHKLNREIALAGEVAFSLAPQLELTLGSRLFLARSQEEEGDDADGFHQNRFGITPNAALTWRPAPKLMLWGRYASAIRPGGLNPGATEGAAQSFASDRLDSLELGWRIQGAGRRLTIEGSSFAFDWRNLQSDMLQTNGLIGTLNAGDGRNLGAEMLVRWAEREWLVESGVTLQKPELIHATGPLVVSEDSWLPTVPRIRMHVRIEMPALLLPESPLIGISLHHVGSARLSFDPQLDRKSAASTTLDAWIDWKRGPYHLSLTATNLTNSDADSFAFGNPFSIRSGDQRTPTRPRTVSLRVERSF